MESFAVSLIRQTRDAVFADRDIPHRERIAVVRTLNILLEALANAKPPTLSTNPREIPNSRDQ